MKKKMLAIAMHACFFFLEKKKYAMKSLKFYPDTAFQSSIKKRMEGETITLQKGKIRVTNQLKFLAASAVVRAMSVLFL